MKGGDKGDPLRWVRMRRGLHIYVSRMEHMRAGNKGDIPQLELYFPNHILCSFLEIWAHRNIDKRHKGGE